MTEPAKTKQEMLLTPFNDSSPRECILQDLYSIPGVFSSCGKLHELVLSYCTDVDL